MVIYIASYPLLDQCRCSATFSLNNDQLTDPASSLAGYLILEAKNLFRMLLATTDELALLNSEPLRLYRLLLLFQRLLIDNLLHVHE